MIDTNNSKIGNPFPFRVFCQKVIPLAFDESMSYLELLYSLLHYIKEVVIPAVNNNADAVEELQNLYNELKSYVDNYFDDLDVQEEINNKLDEMAEGGQLADIIAQYLQLAGVLAFNTLNDMKNATNLVNGSIAKTLGNTTYNDGYGAFYKIRYILNTDVVDNDNIVALTNFNNLIAEKIKNQYIENNTNDIKLINSKVTICIGDSYGVGTTAGSQTITGWCDRLKNLMGLSNSEYYKFVEGGCGFIQRGQNNHTFLELLQANINSVTNKNIVKNIIVCGGYNDRNQGSTPINEAVYNFIQYCKTQFPNAKVYVGMVGVSSAVSDEGSNIRKSLYNDVLRGYQNCTNYGGIYLNNIEYVLRNYGDFMSTDTIHPNNSGYDYLTFHILQCLKSGSCDVNMPYRTGTINLIDLHQESGQLVIYNKMINGNVMLSCETGVTIRLNTLKTTSSQIDLGTYNFFYFRDVYSNCYVDIKYYIQNANQSFGGFGRLHFKKDGHLILETEILANDGNGFVNTENIFRIHINPFSKTFIF